MPKLATNIGIIMRERSKRVTGAAPAAPNREVAELQAERAEVKSKIEAVYASDPSLPPPGRATDKRAELAEKIKATQEGTMPASTKSKLLEPLKATDAKLQKIEQYQAELKTINAELDRCNREISAQAAKGENKFSTQALGADYATEQTEVGEWRAKNTRGMMPAETDEAYAKYLEGHKKAEEEYNSKRAAVQKRIDNPRKRKEQESQELYDQTMADLKAGLQQQMEGLKKEAPAPLRQQRPAETEEEYLKKKETLARSDLQVTKYFDQEQREASEVNFDKNGQAVGNTKMNRDGTMQPGTQGVVQGSKAQDKEVDFVMSKTGQMHQFGNKPSDAGGTGINPMTGKEMNKLNATHHSSVLAGDDVAAAGEMVLDYQGYLKKINNKSGHYKPGATQVIQLLEELAKQGALLDKNYVMLNPDDPEAEAVPLAGKPLEIFKLITSLEAGLKAKLADAKNIEPELAAIKQAKDALAKFGAAPSNKFRSVQVEFLDGAAKKTGIEIKSSKGTDSTAKEFLETGGGYRNPADNLKQATNKAIVHTQIKETLAAKKVTLDKNAEALADKIASADLAKTIKDLPEIYTHFQNELEEALKDETEQGPEKRKKALANILRLEAVANMEKTLAELSEIYAKDKAAEEALDEPVLDRASSMDQPALDRASSMDQPVLDRASSMDQPVLDRASSMDQPVLDRASSMDQPVLDRASSMNEPALGRKSSMDEEPALGRKSSMDDEPVLGRKSSMDEEPALGRKSSMDDEPVLGRKSSMDDEPVLGRKSSMDDEPELGRKSSLAE